MKRLAEITSFFIIPPYDDSMTFAEFQGTAETMLDEIPEEFVKGLQGLHVLEQVKPEPDLPGVYRMGEYLDPGPDSFLGSNPGLGRHIALYYGSFAAIARGNPTFDWEEELWDTITHELQHHVESLAGDDSLIEEDRRRDAMFRKRL
jgi:Zincin-like metallopeptidase